MPSQISSRQVSHRKILTGLLRFTSSIDVNSRAGDWHFGQGGLGGNAVEVASVGSATAHTSH